MAPCIERRDRWPSSSTGFGPTNRSRFGWVSEWTAPWRPFFASLLLTRAGPETGTPEQPLGLLGPKWPR